MKAAGWPIHPLSHPGRHRRVHADLQGGCCAPIFYGGHNAHGRFEFAPVESLKTGVRTVKALVSPALVERVISGKEQ